MDFQSKEFKTLQAKWYKKAKESGFEDIEKDEQWLKRHTGFYGKDHLYRTEYARARRDYYIAAGQFLHSHLFDNEVDRRIWELHANGVSIRDIVKTLKAEKLWFKKGLRLDGKPRIKQLRPCKFTVHNVIKELKSTMLKQLKEEVADARNY